MKGEVHSEYWVNCGKCGVRWHPDVNSWHPTTRVYSRSEFIDKICGLGWRLGWRLGDDGWICPECARREKNGAK